ncbi:MAG: hypothetical protein GWN73_00605, partial [Actinobacteria bacterium]|nr:hypothetical protein [Actinomycetota bacterium]
MRAVFLSALLVAGCGGAAPAPERPAPPPTPVSVDVLAYNAWLLPPIADDRLARATAMPEHLGGYDVVVVSELFDAEAREAFAAG